MTPGQLALVRPTCRTSEGCYAAGCRTPVCREAHRINQAARRRAIAYGTHQPALTTTIGTRRRVQALATLGWTPVDIARRIDVSNARIYVVLEQDRITRTLAARIATVYDELWNREPQQTTRGQRVSAARSRAKAARNGWAAPLDWDDDEIDDPNAVPHTPVGCSSWDLQPCGTDAAARRHHRAGEPLDEACRRASNRIATERRARRAAQVRADLDALTA